MCLVAYDTIMYTNGMPKSPSPSIADQARFRELYVSGLRLVDVARETGFCVSTVTKFMRLIGCASRPKGKKKGQGPVRQFDDASLVDFKARWDRLDSTVKGSISETHVKVKLSEIGFDVWEPFCQNHRTDMIIFSGQKSVRIQVKSATYDVKTKAFRANVTRHRRTAETRGDYSLADVDFFMIYCGGLDTRQFYVVPAQLVIGRSDMKLYPHRAKEPMKEGPAWEEYLNKFDLLGLL